jgi:threonyl-tRNA synthetase
MTAPVSDSAHSSAPFSNADPTTINWLNTLVWTPVAPDDFKNLPKDEQLKRIRHSTAHVLASALAEKYDMAHGGISFAIGPATPQGFFYDIKTRETLREEDLADIQERMAKIAGKSQTFEVAEVPKNEAIQYFGTIHQIHKLEILERILGDTVTLYRHGHFVDLCAGPHVPHTGLCRNHKLLSLAGAHWHGEDTPSLTRVTGTAWATDKDLAKYLEFLEDSKARDHRVLGPQLGLFNFHPWAASAMWHPDGVTLRKTLMGFWQHQISEDYQEILNPLIYRKELFETSGHWAHFQQNMFVFHEPADTSKAHDHGPGCQHGHDVPEGVSYALKPMNCPDTMLFFKSQIRSYRELPLRIAEGQILHRNEATGAMHGLMRTRNFVQDDAHLFVTSEQVEAEISTLLEMIDRTYALFDLNYKVNLSTRPENYMGELATWDKAEAALKAALEKAGKPFGIDEGEGAFYGPKIDVTVMDNLGRQWQCGTVQLDFQLPERFDLHYVAQDGSQQRPIVIHRAVFGSFERFLGILIEHLGGAFPTWLSPVQARVLPISEKHVDYANTVVKRLKAEGFRVRLSDEDSLNYRIRNAETAKTPYILVVGDREAEAGTVAVRTYSDGNKGTKSLDDLVSELQDKCRSHAFDVKVKSYASLFIQDDSVSTEHEAY